MLLRTLPRLCRAIRPSDPMSLPSTYSTSSPVMPSRPLLVTPFQNNLPERDDAFRRQLNRWSSNLPSTYSRLMEAELGNPQTARAILNAPYPNVNVSLIACLTYMIRSGAWDNAALYEELDALLERQ